MSESSANSSRGLVKSMMVIGGAQALKILISIVRMKLIALWVGPVGVGLFSIYYNLQDMAARTAGIGIATSGVREIAGSRGDERSLDKVRYVLVAAHWVQGFLAMLVIWLLRNQIAEWLLGDVSYGPHVGLVGVAVLLSLVASAQTTLLQGMRRISDLGRVTVYSTLFGTMVGLPVIGIYGKDGIIPFVLLQPIVLIVVVVRYARRLPRPVSPRPNLSQAWAIWKSMAGIGVVLMLGGLGATTTLLVVRGYIVQELGLEAAGYFAASWGITMTYVGFLLSAMTADYLPRLSEVINDRNTANRLMNDQAQLGLAIGGPMLLLLIGLAPLLIRVLYAPSFTPAVELLQWQSVGNVFKLASWALSFAVVAAARSKSYLIMEASFNVVFLALIWFLLPVYGLSIAAIGFVIGYVVYFFTVYTLTSRFQGFRWEALSLQLFALHTVLAFALLVLAQTMPVVGGLASVVLAGATWAFGLRVVLMKMGPEGKIPARLYGVYASLGWPIRSEK